MRCSWKRARLAALLLTFLVEIISSSVLRAQPPGSGGATATLSDDPLPEIPETVVPGRPNSFPASPLDENTVISPTRNATSTRDVGSSYTVITSEQIAAKQQQTVAEVLRGAVGLDVVRSGGPGGVTSVFLRGANSAQTKVLLDGIPINDPSNATRNFDFSNLMADNIERIEIVRGPSSVQYGSDAIGGVINIVTKRGQGPLTVRAGAMGGSFGTSQEQVQVSGGDQRAYYSISGSYLNTNGISSANSQRGNREPDGYRNGTLSGRVGWNPSEDWNVDYVFRYTDARVEIDDFSFVTGLPIDNLIRANLARQFFNRVQLTNFAVDGLIEQRVGFNLTDYNRKDTDSGPFIPPQFLGQTREVDYLANVTLTENNTLTAGAVYHQEEASTTFNPQAVLTNKAAYLQDQLRLFDRWTTNVGVRWDDYNPAGPAQTYRVSSIYNLDETGTAFHGSLGTGFRAPSLAESLFQFGNPNLRPEQSKGWDAGVRQQVLDGAITFDATYFRNDLTDLIIFDFNTFSLENIGRARTSGVEFTGTCNLTQQVTLTGNYTFTDTLNLDTGDPLLRRPREKAQVGINRVSRDNRARVGLYANLVGQRLDTGNNVLGRYSLIYLNGRYQWTDRCEFFARIDNVFNERYEEVRGFGVPGVSGYAGATLTW